MDDLYEALLLLKTKEETERFLKDLCTPAEIKALTGRWNSVKLLDQGDISYRDISARTGMSVTTIGRVSRFLNDEPYQGYKTILARMKKQRAN